MRKLVLMMGISLAGLTARPGKFGAGGWGVPSEDLDLKARKLDWLREVDLHLMGASPTRKWPRYGQPPTMSTRSR